MADNEQQPGPMPAPSEPGTQEARRPDPMAIPASTLAPATARAPWRRWALAGVALGILLATATLAWRAQRALFRPITRETHTVVVPRNATLRGIARQLEERRIIPSAFVLRVYARLTRQDTLLKAGEYELSAGMSPVEILQLLNSGRVVSLWVTIPEGKWASEVGPLLAANWPDASAAFNTLISQPERWQQQVAFPLEGPTLEGYLFPDTYLLSKAASAEQIITAMLKTFEAQCWTAYQANRPADGRTFYQVLILASLIEAEAKVPSERPIIAGVYINRMRLGMKLQCDATVLYAHRQRLSRVLYRDLEIDSPYNTYRYPGLPTGPICNPGKSSFMAALHPADVPYLYYVARGDGSHVFSKTIAEHQAAIHQIRGK